ncbi:MAG: hypothetical protein ACOYVD_17545 [Bacillota bacterium]
MKPMVSIIAWEQTETIELAQDVLNEFNIANESLLLNETPVLIEKLHFHASTAQQRGIEVVIVCGFKALQHLSPFHFFKSIPIIYVPTGDALDNEINFLQISLEKKWQCFLETESNDAHVAGLWAAELLASKHWCIYNSLNRKRQVS